MISCLIFSAASVSAAEINNTDQELSTSSNIDTLCANVEEDAMNNTNTLGVSENLNDLGENNILLKSNNENILSLSNDEILGDSNNMRTFSDFYKLYLISSDVMTLNTDYKYDSATDADYADGFTIDRTITIDGKGHTIDANGIKLFKITANNVIIKNIKVMNTATSDSDYAAILWLGNNGELINSSFIKSTNNKPNIGDVEYSGCIKWMGDDGKITGCYFTETSIPSTTASSYNAASAVLSSSKKLNISHTVFYKTYNQEAFVATMSARNPTVNYCNFTECSSKEGIIFSRRSQVEINHCNFVSCYAQGEALIFSRGYSFINNCYFTKNTGTAILQDSMSVYNSIFENNGQSISIHRIYVGSTGFSFVNCQFIGGNKAVHYSEEAGNDATKKSIVGGSFINCTFKNIKKSTQNAIIYGRFTLLTMENCSFISCSNTRTNYCLLRFPYGSGYGDKFTLNNLTFTGCQGNKIAFASSAQHLNYDSITAKYLTSAQLKYPHFTAYKELYVQSGANGIGTIDDPCSLTFALQNLDYGGTIHVKAGIYNEWKNDIRYNLYGSMIGYGGEVITNKLTFDFQSIGGTVENIILNDSNANFKLITNNKFINVTVSNRIIPSNCIFTYNYGEGAKNFRMINCTIDNVTFNQLCDNTDFVTADIINLTIKKSIFNKLLYLHTLNYNNFTKIKISNSTFSSLIDTYNSVDLKTCDLSDVELINDTINNQIINCYNDNYGYIKINNFILKDIIFSSNVADNLFDFNYNSEIYGLSLNNTTEFKNLIKFNNEGNSIKSSSFDLFNATQLVNSSSKYGIDVINISNVNLVTSFNLFDKVNLNKIIINNSNFTSGVIFTLPGGSLTNSRFSNFTGHVLVNGSGVKVSGSEFINGNNSGLNGSVFEVLGTGNYFNVQNCNFTNNTAYYGGAIYIHYGVTRSTYKNINFTNNTAVGPDPDSDRVYDLNNSAGGAIKFEWKLGTGYYVTIDDFTNGTTNHTSWFFNNIAGNLTYLVADFVYVVNDPNTWYGNDTTLSTGNARSWENAGSFNTAFSIAGDGCTLVFVRYGDVFNETYLDYYGKLMPDFITGFIMSDDLVFKGNNTIIEGLRFHIPDYLTSFTAYNITLKNNNDSALIISGGNVLFQNCSVENSGSDTVRYGGAVQVNGGNVIFKDTTFTNNTALNYGGALYINTSNVLIDNCTFKNNTVSQNGAHIYMTKDNNNITITGSRFANSTINYEYLESLGDCSGVVIQGTNIYVTENNFTNNTGKIGGALSVIGDNAFLYVLNNNFTNNSAINGSVYLSFTNNLAADYQIYNNAFTGNNATNGGALYIDEVPIIGRDIGCNNFTGNNATLGGAVFVNDEDFTFIQSHFMKNNATLGGAVYVNASNIVFNLADFTGNNATLGGAAYLNVNGTVFNNCTFIANTAPSPDSFGSAIYVADNITVTVNSCRFDRNQVYGENGTLSRADLSYDGILPGISKDTVWTKDPYQQYAHNRTAVTIYYKMVYVSLQDRGQGYSNATATTMEKALKGILPDGVIIICDDEYTWNETTLKMLHDANLVNVTFQGLTSKTSIKRTNDQQNNKYLFNPLKKIKNLSLNNYLSSQSLKIKKIKNVQNKYFH